ncbi:hypothetical protein [Nocardia sp. SC052]|uniref:hypothetical protein n=1 Tax=Nocardia sichangensis TaxID=3385975 RepID=UPI0039A1D34B
MAEPECSLTELPVSMCAHCRKQDLPKPEPLYWFTARYHGRCADCSRPIEPGDEIAATDDGHVCRRCA